MAMLPELSTYDWEEAFHYARRPRRVLPDRTKDDCWAGEGFTREDVVEIVSMEEGEHEGPSWLGVFKLRDGCFAFLTAGCDYTGWDCQSWGDSYVSEGLFELIRWGLGNEDRDRLGLVLHG